MKCPRCDSENPEGTKFCGECGTKLDARKTGIGGDTPDYPASGPSRRKLKVKSSSIKQIPASELKDQISFTKTLETTTDELSPGDELSRGTVFAGRYEIIEELGTGGMGRVYRAFDKKIDEEVAIKLLKPEIAVDRKTVERFRNELKIARRITHKNVCRTHDLGEEGKALFITMEYVRGEDLKSLIRRTKQLAPGTAVSVAHQVAEGLAEAHKLGVVHRDLKPHNIMIDRDGNAKIMDFGIARTMAGAGTTVEGAIIGTPEYMSPEQVEGKPADQRADIYALGVILFEMVTGEPPFEGENPLAIASKHRYEPAPDPRTLNPHIPADLSRMILLCLEKDREARYQTTAELLAGLEAVEASLPKAERVPTGRPSTRRKPTPSKTITVKITRRRLLLPALALVATFSIIIGLMNFLSKAKSNPFDCIAVLPFRYLAENKEREYWAEAMTSGLIGKLGQVSGLKKVIAYQSARQYKDSTKKASEIARELGVNCLVEGDILLVENRARISVRLIDAKSERNLWANDYNRDTRDILTLQNEVTRTIVSEIKVKLTPLEEARLAKAAPVNPITYDSLNKSLFHSVGQYSLEEGFRISIENLNEIIQQDPGFAPPYVTLALQYWNMAGMLVVQPQIGFLKARELATKALELDDTIGFAHAILGSLKAILDYDYVGAQEQFNTAIALSPNDATLFNMYTIFLNFEGRFDEALETVRRCIELDPLEPFERENLAWTYYHAGRYSEALEEFKKLAELLPNFVFAHLYLLRTLIEKNLRQESLAQAEKIMTLPEANQDAHILATVGYAYGTLGERSRAESCLELLRQLSQKKFVDPQLMAWVYVGLGDTAHAFEWLEKACEEHSYLSLLKVDPIWKPLRNAPRFQAILKKVGIV